MNVGQFFSNNIADATLQMQDLHYVFDRKMAKEGLLYKITRVACLEEVQEALYDQGRKPWDVVNGERKSVGLYLFKDPKENRVVTWTVHSMHIADVTHPFARAFDIVILLSGGKPTWDIKVDTNASGHPAYYLAGQIWKKCGGIFGGDFPNPDRCHMEQPKQ